MSAWWLVALLGINAAGFVAIVSVQQLQLSQLRRVFELLAEVRASQFASSSAAADADSGVDAK